MADTDQLNRELAERAELEHRMAIGEVQGAILRHELERSRKERAEIEARTQRTREESAAEARQHALEMALRQVHCLDVPAAVRVFRDQVATNAAGDVVFVEEGTGKHYPLAEGLAQAMPDYWKPARNKGGSGCRSGHVPSRSPRNTELDRERAKLDQLKRQYHRSGGSVSVLNQLTKQLTTVKVVEELEQRRKGKR